MPRTCQSLELLRHSPSVALRPALRLPQIWNRGSTWTRGRQRPRSMRYPSTRPDRREGQPPVRRPPAPQPCSEPVSSRPAQGDRDGQGQLWAVPHAVLAEARPGKPHTIRARLFLRSCCVQRARRTPRAATDRSSRYWEEESPSSSSAGSEERSYAVATDRCHRPEGRFSQTYIELVRSLMFNLAMLRHGVI